MTNEKVLGVLGGMGPDATANFIQEVIAATPAERDEDHIETIVYNDPKIPDRNEAILEGAESPLPRMSRNAERLESVGADVIAIPCNTAHYYYDEVASSVDVDVFHMIELTRERVELNEVEKAGLLATSTVMETRLYRDVFDDSPVDIVHPEAKDRLMDAIYAVKRGNRAEATAIVDDIITGFADDGVEVVLVGCSDLSVLASNWSLTTVDPIRVLADACVATVQ